MSRDERILQRKLRCQIRRIDGFIETVDSIIEAGETVRLEIMGEELKEIKEKIEKLYDELFSLDEVDIDKESEACDSSMNKIGSLRSPTGQRFPSHHDNKRMLRKIGTCPKKIRSDDYRGWKHTSAAFFIDKDADYQRILWRPSPEEPVVDYRLLTVTYGTTSAPFLAMRTLQQLAEDEGQNYPEASRVTLNDFYVDDLLTGAQTIAETKELIDQLKDLMKRGGFHLRKWNSNCHEIVSHVEEMNEEKKINLEKGAISKILGIVWDHVQDTFRVNITLPEEVVTKRDLLSNIARIFDPLGFLSPTTVALKIIMQELWRGGTGWDEHIPNDIKEKWNNFRAELLKLGDLSIPRYVWACEKDQDVQLHGFCDAWKTFIHNRVVKIQQLSDRNSWRHVSGKDNPADCASRGIMPAALSGHTLWWQGPTWLKDNNFVQNKDNCYGRECHEEEKVALACQSRVSVCPEVVTKYSTFIKTRRIIAWCLRFITNCRVSLKKREIGTLSKKELENAVIRIIGWIQKDEFGEEMQDLRNTGHASRKSRILQLNPFIDASGMLRTGAAGVSGPSSSKPSVSSGDPLTLGPGFSGLASTKSIIYRYFVQEIGGEGFDDFGEHDIEELLVDEALNDDDILESMVDTTKDFETVDSELEDVTPLDEKLLREGLQLSGKLEIFFIQNDNDVERALKFQRDLKFCMSGYRELYKELVKPSQRLITDYLVKEKNH
ncbi:hypothetical protein LAZ67_14000618 [Cordylochernes scorpioides]|uniref:Reverse transcriptase domain-containing protein n=1 Tax=Cordylochernes scorpioides TaxID=51811 RepID=A0ABY6L896_9ARAC|nr:hypothetical protein LAZ67_14000618 [Cordylochernes scorpioides]